jgi:putative ABC transport system ATP-binding protein
VAEHVLRTVDLVKEHRSGAGAQRALAGVTLEIEAGRFVSVMGPSGSGKSTLLHLLAGLDTPTSGEVWFEGCRLSDLTERERTAIRRRRVGFVFQQFNLVPVLTVAENIALPLVIDRVSSARRAHRLDAVLELTRLGQHRGKLPAALSGGEQQRAAIARALITQPAVVFADEPTGSLDTETGVELLSLVRSTQVETGQTIVLVTHDARAASFGDEVIRLSDGAVAARHVVGRDRRGRPRRDVVEVLQDSTLEV